MSFLEEITKRGLVSEDEARQIRAETDESGDNLEDVLMRHGLEENQILRVRGEYLNIPISDIPETGVPFEILNKIPEDSARHYRFVPLGLEEDVLQVGMVDPDNIEALDALQFISTKIGIPYKVYLISKTDFDALMDGYKGLTGEMSGALSELEGELSVPIKDSKEDIQEETSGQAMRIVEDAPVTKMVAVILRHATEGNASDVHIEHMGEKVRVRFRVDGTLHTSIFLPVSVHSAVIARIKILSNLKLDEKRKPQDGRFSARIDNRKIDFRVSTFPAYYGEKVVMRILDTQKGVKGIDALDLGSANLKAVRSAIARPYGMILITGPTGSGKSTTLYSMLSELDREGLNIVSLEDPVEYNIPGISQSQVKPEIGYSFANGLRSILRQDPDVIMVGEIRDKETAQLAVQAALTGHLVFSTLHTNTATGVIPRLIDMGVDPYLITPTLILAIGQRLVQTLCPGAGNPIALEDSMKVMIEKQFSDLPEQYRSKLDLANKVYEAVPTDSCPTGVRGRTAVFEVLEMNKSIEEAILNDPVESEIYKAARVSGMITMKEDAILKAFRGIIPFVEVNQL